MKLLKNATSGKKVVRTKALLSRGVVASRSSSSSSSSRTRREERRRDLKDTLLCFAEEERGGKQLGASTASNLWVPPGLEIPNLNKELVTSSASSSSSSSSSPVASGSGSETANRGGG